MNQPILDAYLDELLGPAPGEPAHAAPAAAPLADDEVVHVAVADAVTDATHDALAVALLDGYDDDVDATPVAIRLDADAGARSDSDTDESTALHAAHAPGTGDADAESGAPSRAETQADVDAGVDVDVDVDVDVEQVASASAGAAVDVGMDSPLGAGMIAPAMAAPDVDAEVAVDAASPTDADDAASIAAAPVAPAPAFDADALAAALLEEFDRETAVVVKPTKAAPAPAPTPAVDDDLAAALLAEFDQELEARSAPAKPAMPRPTTKPVSAPLPAEPVARAGSSKRFELPESFAPVPPVRAVETPPAMRPKADGRPGQARTGRWLRVCVDEDRYAVELLSVQEVVRVAPIVSMRGADAAVLGVMNLRGRIVPVFDLGLWLGTNAVCPDERSRIVVVERNDELIGLLVTAVQDVVTLAEAHIEPPLGAGLRGAIVGVARANDAPTVLLDANWLFD